MPTPPKAPFTLHMPFPSLGYAGDVALIAVAGLEYPTPAQTSEAVLELLGAGVPAISCSCQVYAERRFADQWCNATRRFRTPPKRGVRLTSAINRTLDALANKEVSNGNV